MEKKGKKTEEVQLLIYKNSKKFEKNIKNRLFQYNFHNEPTFHGDTEDIFASSFDVFIDKYKKIDNITSGEKIMYAIIRYKVLEYIVRKIDENWYKGLSEEEIEMNLLSPSQQRGTEWRKLNPDYHKIHSREHYKNNKRERQKKAREYYYEKKEIDAEFIKNEKYRRRRYLAKMKGDSDFNRRNRENTKRYIVKKKLELISN